MQLFELGDFQPSLGNSHFQVVPSLRYRSSISDKILPLLHRRRDIVFWPGGFIAVNRTGACAIVLIPQGNLQLGAFPCKNAPLFPHGGIRVTQQPHIFERCDEERD